MKWRMGSLHTQHFFLWGGSYIRGDKPDKNTANQHPNIPEGWLRAKLLHFGDLFLMTYQSA